MKYIFWDIDGTLLKTCYNKREHLFCTVVE